MKVNYNSVHLVTCSECFRQFETRENSNTCLSCLYKIEKNRRDTSMNTLSDTEYDRMADNMGYPPENH